MKTEVYCDTTTCEYYKNQRCTKDIIELVDDSCLTFGAHTEMSKEYQETFWKALTSRKDGHKCRQEARGKRYEFGGIVFFTDQDDRWGLAGLSFTEQVTGYRVPADVLTGRKAKPEFLDRVREIIGKVPPVMSLPEADLEDVWTGRPISGGDDK